MVSDRARVGLDVTWTLITMVLLVVPWGVEATARSPAELLDVANSLDASYSGTVSGSCLGHGLYATDWDAPVVLEGSQWQVINFLVRESDHFANAPGVGRVGLDQLDEFEAEWHHFAFESGPLEIHADTGAEMWMLPENHDPATFRPMNVSLAGVAVSLGQPKEFLHTDPFHRPSADSITTDGSGAATTEWHTFGPGVREATALRVGLEEERYIQIRVAGVHVVAPTGDTLTASPAMHRESRSAGSLGVAHNDTVTYRGAWIIGHNVSVEHAELVGLCGTTILDGVTLARFSLGLPMLGTGSEPLVSGSTAIEIEGDLRIIDGPVVEPGARPRSHSVVAGNPANVVASGSIVWEANQLTQSVAEASLLLGTVSFVLLAIKTLLSKGVLLFSRLKPGELAEHRVRAAVLDLLREEGEPVALHEVVERTGRPRSTLRHHIRVLEQQNVVASFRAHGKLFIALPSMDTKPPTFGGTHDDHVARAIVALVEEGVRRQALARRAAEAAGVSERTVRRRIVHLEQAGVLRAAQDKRGGSTR